METREGQSWVEALVAPATPGKPGRSSRSDERGFALVSVLLVAISIALLALGLMGLVRETATSSAAFRADAEIKAACEAGLNRIVLAFTRADDPLRAQLIPDGRPVAWAFGGKNLILRVQAESGKLDLNAADREHIAAVVRHVLEDAGAQAHFLGRLDDLRASGKQIVSVAQLLPAFDRMTNARDRAEAYFTVMTNQRGVDWASAPPIVLNTMPGVSDQTRRAILAARAGGRRPSVQALSDELRLFVSEKPFYTFRVEASEGFERAGAMRAVVGFSSQNELAIYAWQPAGLDH